MHIYKVAVKGKTKMLYLAFSEETRTWYLSSSADFAEPFNSRIFALQSLQNFCKKLGSFYAMQRLMVYRENNYLYFGS